MNEYFRDRITFVIKLFFVFFFPFLKICVIGLFLEHRLSPSFSNNTISVKNFVVKMLLFYPFISCYFQQILLYGILLKREKEKEKKREKMWKNAGNVGEKKYSIFIVNLL